MEVTGLTTRKENPFRHEPLIVHALPAAPQFVGRGRELAELENFWQVGRGIFALVGIGGAGKTAILQQFIDTHLHDPSLDGALVWSFYDDPDTNAFLQTTVSYLDGRVAEGASGIGWYHSLRSALDSDRKYLLILDGLERVQRATTDAVGLHGEMEDPLLRSLLVRLATSSSRSQVIVTSRFHLADLERVGGGRYWVLDIDKMDGSTAVQLLSQRGVKGSSEDLLAFGTQLGRHALTLDLASTVVTRYFDGDPSKLPWMDSVGVYGEAEQSVILGQILQTFEDNMSTEERDLMSRMCIYRFGVSLQAVVQLFEKNPETAGSLIGKSVAELQGTADSLVDSHLVHLTSDGTYSVHPAVRDHFYRSFRDTENLHGAITKHLLNLSGRPGIGLPTAKASLDMLEELVHHAARSGNLQAAWDVYTTRMGGDEHLNVALGEYSRCFRVLSQFPPGSDRSAEYHCFRAFGSIGEALRVRPQNTYIRLLGGELADLANDNFAATKTVAQFLRGAEVTLPDSLPDFPLSLAQVYLCADNVGAAETAAVKELAESTFHDDLVRNQIALAEVSRRNGEAERALERLSKPSEWALRSGSCEHLAAYFLVRGAIETDMGNYRSAKTTFEEALQVCYDAGFRLLEVDLLALFARLLMTIGEEGAAYDAATLASQAAASQGMGYVWGECRAQRVLADVCTLRKREDEAVNALRRLAMLQRSLGMRGAAQTEQELRTRSAQEEGT